MRVLLMLATFAVFTPPACGVAQDVRRITPNYELYAPTQMVLDSIAPTVDSAVVRFRRHFRAEPGGVAVVVIADAVPREQRNAASFGERGLAVMPWPVGIAAQRAAASAGVMAAAPREGVLAHEVCHLFYNEFAERRYGSAPRARSGVDASYGHPAVPDWLEESAALLCEDDEMMARRRESARAQSAERPSLQQLLTMSHPLIGAVTRVPVAGESAFRAVDPANIPPEAREKSRQFYTYAASFASFLVAHEEPDVLARLLDAVMTEGSDGTALIHKLKSLPTNLAELERKWRAWER